MVDHVEPICLFDWWTDEGLKEAFHWSNVQPLWYKEHREKTSLDLREARVRKMKDSEYRKRLPNQYLPPLEGSNDEILAQLQAQIGR